jgi:hypothetical protein
VKKINKIQTLFIPISFLFIMDSTAHGAHAFWLFYAIHFLIWQEFPAPIYSALILLFGNLPDFDGLYWKLKGGQHDNNFQHHLYFWSHWPISWIPVVVIMIFSFITSLAPQFFLCVVVGVYAHLISDSASCGDGMMWSKIPWKKDQFAPFINLGSSKTDGYHGRYWTVRWRTTWTYKLAIIQGILIIILMIVQMIRYGFVFFYLVVILFFIISMLSAFVPIHPKYYEEPPNGRFDDYRKHPAYLQWMEQNNYVFNTQMQVVRKK